MIAAKQNQKFPSFQIFRFAAGGVGGGAANKNDRKFLGFAPRELVLSLWFDLAHHPER